MAGRWRLQDDSIFSTRKGPISYGSLIGNKAIYRGDIRIWTRKWKLLHYNQVYIGVVVWNKGVYHIRTIWGSCSLLRNNKILQAQADLSLEDQGRTV